MSPKANIAQRAIIYTASKLATYFDCLIARVFVVDLVPTDI